MKKTAVNLNALDKVLTCIASLHGLIAEARLTKPKLNDLIVKSPDFVEEDVKVIFDSIVKDRILTEEKEEKLRREEREYEEKLRREEREYEEKLRRAEREYEEKLRREEREYEEKLRREEREYELEKL
ncbi:hypothetical protein TNCV_2145891 [Trichonephila clavipes]|uniref:Uncharacterized protein n=1 Tax=Trichonephila clavipes TaxID=2585209 RepID=A0A8X6T4C2_TRICX|nr:hypothetical protein TNCV_2145891 [Trichonephila clavipes]